MNSSEFARRDNARDVIANRVCLGLAVGAMAIIASVMFPDGLLRRLDWHAHLCWLQGFQHGLAQGAWYPRWVDAANEGQGGPVFAFYAPLAYYLGSAWMALGLHVANALKAVYAVSLLLCAGGIFVWLRTVCGNARAGIIAAVGVLTPQLTLFAFLYNMPASALAVGVLPWIGFALERRDGVAGRIAVLAAALATLLLSHALTAMQAFMLLAVVGAIALCLSRARGNALRVLLPAALLSVAMAAMYLLPMLAGRPLVHAEHLLESAQWRIDGNLQFAWLFGHAASAQAPRAFEVANALALLLLAIAALRLGVRDGWRRQAPWVAYAVAALATFALMTPLALPLYERVEALRFLQFGWRWQALFALCVMRVVAEAVRVGDAINASNAPSRSTRPLLVVGALGGAGIVACMVSITPPFARAAGEDPALQRVGFDEAQRYADRCEWPVLEYRPVAMGRNWRQGLGSLPAQPTVLSGRAHVLSAQVHAQEKRYDIVADIDARVVFPVLDFAGWTVQRDTAFDAAQGVSDDGRIVVDLPRGRHAVVLRFEAWRSMRVGAWISAAGVAVWLGLALMARRRAREAQPRVDNAQR